MITAKEAATALRNVADKLAHAGILMAEGQGYLYEEAGRLSKKGNVIDWDMGVPKDRPLRFKAAHDKNGEKISVYLSAEGIRVNQSDHSSSPFEALDAAIVVKDKSEKVIARWHIDRANVSDEAQPGPLFHLQFGGHLPGSTDPDPVLKVPRWCHPPLEIALLCEVVAANFFHNEWDEKLRRDAGWCKAIHTFQRLCFDHYFAKMRSAVVSRDSTALGFMWADEWS